MPLKTNAPIGLLDIGSNSIRFVVYEPPYLGEHPAFNEKVQCSLGKDLVRMGKLYPAGKTCALEAISGFKSLAKAMNVKHIYAMATAAIRDAKDGAAFAKKIENETGIKIEIVSGEKEAEYAALGVLSAFPHAKGIIGDMGGGSLELAHVHKNKVISPLSLPLGALRLMAHKPPAEYIKSNLKDLSPDFTGEKLFYAVGGTWRTIAYCHQLSKNKKSYNLENYRVAAKEMIEFADKLSKCSGKTLIEKYHVEHTRAELLPYSALMLAKLLKKVKAKTIIFTSTSLREGKLMEILKS